MEMAGRPCLQLSTTITIIIHNTIAVPTMPAYSSCIPQNPLPPRSIQWPEHSAQSYLVMNLLRKRVGVITLAMLLICLRLLQIQAIPRNSDKTRQDKTQVEKMYHVAVLTCRSPRTKQRGPIMSNVAITINSRPLPSTKALGMFGQMLVSPMAPASPTCATPPTRLLRQVMIPLTVSPSYLVPKI